MTEPSRQPAAVRQPWLEPWVRLSDDQFRIPGTKIRFGLDPVLGAVFPVVGESVTTALSCVIVLIAWRDRVPPALLLRMVGHVAVDALVGSVPVLGDWFDVTYRANRKNLTLLRDFQARHASISGTGGESLTPLPSRKMPAWVLPALIAVMALLLLIPLSVAVLIMYLIWR